MKSSYNEPKNPYYRYYQQEKYCLKILHEFGLDGSMAHIINGHTPIKVSKGESPLKANNRLIVIDGGFCQAYQKTTGIAGYTLIYNSHGMRLKAHQPFESIAKVLSENKDIESSSNSFLVDNNDSRDFWVHCRCSRPPQKSAQKFSLSCLLVGIFFHTINTT